MPGAYSAVIKFRWAAATSIPAQRLVSGPLAGTDRPLDRAKPLDRRLGPGPVNAPARLAQRPAEACQHSWCPVRQPIAPAPLLGRPVHLDKMDGVRRLRAKPLHQP